MVDRSADLTVYWQLNPRAIVLNKSAASPAEMNMQDLADSLRAIEKTGPAMDQDVLIETSGKQDLGGGSLVSITNTLQNAVFGFENRTVSLSDDIITTLSSNGRSVICSAATFIADGVTVGDELINLNDGSITTVRIVVSETELTVFSAENGDDNQYQVNDRIKVWRIVQCDITGGNLVAVDNLGATISQIFKTANTQIKLQSASSGTTTGSIANAILDEALSDHSVSGSVGEAVSRILGMVQENQYIDNYVRDGDGKVISARLRSYSIAASVGTNNDVLATYTVTGVWSGGVIVSYGVVRI